MTVPARTSLVTLGVADVERAAAFYERLGWTRSPASVEGDVAFFGTTGAIVTLFALDAFAADAGMPATPPPAFRGSCLAINLESEAEVDRVAAQFAAAGGTVVKAPVRVDWGGYSGYVADLDGHLWEIAHNPGWPMVDGVPRLP